MHVPNITNVITEFTQKDDYCQDTLAMLIYTQLVTSTSPQDCYPRSQSSIPVACS